MHNAVSLRSEPLIMRNHDQAGLLLPHPIDQQTKYDRGGVTVEIAGWFIGQQA